MTESEPCRIGYWELLFPITDDLPKAFGHFATKQEFDELESAEKPDMTFKHNGPVIGKFDSITDEEGKLIVKGTLNDAGVKFMDDINQDGAEDLLERITKAVPEIMDCLERGRVDRAGLKLEEVKLDLDDYNEGDVS